MESEATLIIAIVSASSAIAGAVISQLVTILRDYLDKRHKRNIFLREKYEELANLVTASQGWFTGQIGAINMLELRTPPVEARKAAVISHIYFPALRDACESYLDACINFQVTLIDSHEFYEGMDAGTQATHKNRKAFEKAVGHLQSCRQHLDEQIMEHAHEYVRA